MPREKKQLPHNFGNIDNMEVALPDPALTISLTVLKNLINNLTTQQLADLPVESLPDHIPMSLLDMTDGRKRATLEDKLLAHQAYVLSVREEIRRELGTAGLHAYDLAQQDFSTAHITRFNNRFLEYQAFKQYFDIDSTEHGELRLLSMLEKEADTAADMQHDYLELLRARKSLSHAALPELTQRRVDKAQANLQALISLHQAYLGQYLSERLALTVKHMTVLTHTVDASSPSWKKVFAKVEAGVSTEDIPLLSSTMSQTPNPTLGDEAPRTLKDQMLLHELPYTESDLTEWMDRMLDYFQHFHDQASSDKLFAKARKYLMHLMNMYFENNAISSHRYLQSLPEEQLADAMQEYHERSRDYVERYFSERAGDLRKQVRETLFH